MSENINPSEQNDSKIGLQQNKTKPSNQAPQLPEPTEQYSYRVFPRQIEPALYQAPASPKRFELRCQKEGLHEGQLLNMVCTEPGCEGELCCNVCIEQSHPTHKAKPLKWLLSEITNRQPKNEQSDAQSELNKVIDTAKSSIIEKYDTVKLALETALAESQKLVKKFLQKLDCLSKFEPVPQPQSELQYRQYAYQVLCAYRASKSPISNAESVKTVKLLTSELTQTLESFQTKFTAIQPIGQMKKLLSRDSYSQTFGQALHHRQMKLISPTRVTFTGQEKDFKIAVISPCIRPGKSEYSFKLKAGNWAAFGLCHLPTIKKYEYAWINYSKPGHGVYGMSASGKIFSHTNQKDNYMDRGYRFNEKDVVIMKIDTSLQKIKFVNETGTRKATVFFQQPQAKQGQDQQGLYVCVMLSTVGAQIEYLGLQ